MRRRTVLLCLLASGVLASPAPGQNAVLDLVPHDADAAVVVRSVIDLKKKGDRLAADANLKVWLRPSQLFLMGYQMLGVQNSVDENGSAALILANPRVLGKEGKSRFEDWNTYLVAVVPFADLDRVGKDLGFAAGELKPGRVCLTTRNGQPCAVYARGRHAFLGDNAKVVEYAATAKRLTGLVPAGRRQTFDKADLLVHLGGPVWKEGWANAWKDRADEVVKGTDPAERETARQLVTALEGVRSALGGVRLDDGLTLNLLFDFPPENKSARALLAKLRGGDRDSGVEALPAGNVLLAQAARGDGSASSALSRLLFDQLLTGLVDTGPVASAAERPLLVGLFQEVWHNLKGSRLAVYQNADPAKHGLFTAVAVLDAEDGKKFFEEMRVLARIADGSKLKLGDTDGPDTLDVAALVRDLGSPLYRKRELATLKLRLVGDPALPYLQKAAGSADAEVARRAELLHRQVTELAARRRKDVLAGDSLRNVRPKLALLPRAETRAGRSVDVLRLSFPVEAPAAQKQLRELFGPDWHNVRLVIDGPRLVVLLGSDTSLLEQTLANLAADRPGLAGAELLAGFRRHAGPARRFELHLALAAALPLADPNQPPPAQPPAPSLTSLGLSIEPDRVGADVHLPLPELRAVAKKWGW